MGIGRYLIDFRVMQLIAQARLYWNPNRTQGLLFAQQCLWQKGLITRWRS